MWSRALNFILISPQSQWHSAIGSLGQKVLQRLHDGSQSVILSPFLLHSTLTILLAGADGDTRSELELLLCPYRGIRSSEADDACPTRSGEPLGFDELRSSYENFVFQW